MASSSSPQRSCGVFDLPGGGAAAWTSPFTVCLATRAASSPPQGLWRGTVPGQLLTVPYTAVQFVALQQCRKAAQEYGLQVRTAVSSSSLGGLRNGVLLRRLHQALQQHRHGAAAAAAAAATAAAAAPPSCCALV